MRLYGDIGKLRVSSIHYTLLEWTNLHMILERELEFLLAVHQSLPDPFNIVLFVMEQYRQKFGRYPDVLHPVTFNEKIQSRKLFDRRPILATIADKFAVREYVAQRIGQEFLPELYHVTTDPLDLPAANLPDRYVVKATHGSGWVERVKNHEARSYGV